MSEFVKKETLPPCDICTLVERKAKPLPAVADVRTASGRWGNLCVEHLSDHDAATCSTRSHMLGTGNGQMFLLPESEYLRLLAVKGQCPYCLEYDRAGDEFGHDDYCPSVYEA